METSHRIYLTTATKMSPLSDNSVDLVVTSPPYPMIAMWDDLFSRLDPAAADALASENGTAAFDAMHRVLDRVWEELWRVVKPGGIVCINVGDAVRTFKDRFRLYPNHARILQALTCLGFSPMPEILWRKPTNSPTKFMGSGMLPAGAYVTLEHEHILILRKGKNRLFPTPSAKLLRRQSAFFWEERNRWFSDIWTDLKGTSQHMPGGTNRKRSAAFPMEVPYRLICMFSVMGDRVLDPFLGTGATAYAAMAAARESVGFETDGSLSRLIAGGIERLPGVANDRIEKRLSDHRIFVREAPGAGRRLRHRNRPYGFAVMTSQETDLFLPPVAGVHEDQANRFRVAYENPAVAKKK